MICRSAYPGTLMVRTEPALRAALADLAKREGLSRSELVRRELRQVVARRQVVTEARP